MYYYSSQLISAQGKSRSSSVPASERPLIFGSTQRRCCWYYLHFLITRPIIIKIVSLMLILFILQIPHAATLLSMEALMIRQSSLTRLGSMLHTAVGNSKKPGNKRLSRPQRLVLSFSLRRCTALYCIHLFVIRQWVCPRRPHHSNCII